MEEGSLCQTLDENVAGNWDSEEEFRRVRPGYRCKANVKLCTLAFIILKNREGETSTASKNVVLDHITLFSTIILCGVGCYLKSNMNLLPSSLFFFIFIFIFFFIFFFLITRCLSNQSFNKVVIHKL